MSIAPTTIEATELEEMLEESVPCESENCKSGHEQPATWLFTHHGTPCATLFCEPCYQFGKAWIDRAIKYNHNQMFKCMRCGSDDIHYRDLIFRRL